MSDHYSSLDKAHTTPIYAKTVPLVTQYFIPREEIWKKMTNAVINTKQNKRIVLVRDMSIFSREKLA